MAPSPLSSTAPTARSWAALIVLTLAVMILAIDATVLSLAVPSLAADLAPSASQLLWIGDVYSFVLAGLLVTMGNVADRIGRRRLLLVGTVGFGLSSVMAALAPTAGALIAARAVLGLSGSTIMPSTLSLVRNIFPDVRHRTTAIAIWSAGSAGGTALGPLVGGFLLEHYWWGSVFLVNVPVMLLVLATGLWLLPESRHDGGDPIDLLSSALSVLTIVPLVYAAKTFAHDGASAAAVVCVAVGLVTGWAFIRRQRTLSTPLIDVGLFAKPAFTWAVLSSVIAIFSLAGLLYFFSQYLQLVRGYPALRAGVAELPMSLASIAVVVLVTRLVARLGQGHALGGALGLIALGFLALAGAESSPSYLPLAGSLVLVGCGCGIASAVSTGAVLGAVPASRAGAASAISETGFELGAALGIAVLGSVQDIGYRTFLGEVNGVPGSLSQAAHQSLPTLVGLLDLADPTQTALLQQARTAFTHAMQVTACLATALLVLAALMAWRYVPVGDVAEHGPAETTEE